jgi:hypothetical protein
MSLSKEEELRLASFLDVTKADLEKDVTYASEYYVSAVRWLAEKLKETNEELKRANAEITSINEAFNWPKRS